MSSIELKTRHFCGRVLLAVLLTTGLVSASPGLHRGGMLAMGVSDNLSCGDLVLDPGEQCDDGNNADNDGCQSNCTFPLGSADGFVSEDFTACPLPARLTIVDPFGAGQVSVAEVDGESRLQLILPAGVAHDAWGSTGNESLRVMQGTLDADLEVEAKFESEPTGDFANQGLIFEQDADNFLRFDVYHDGTSLRAFAGIFADGQPVTPPTIKQPLDAGTARFVRVTRAGHDWELWQSADALDWQRVGGFKHLMQVSKVGVFAANPRLARSYTAEIDYLVNVAAPMPQEDGALFSCDDDDPCTQNVCDAVEGTCGNTPKYDLATECCNPADGSIEPIGLPCGSTDEGECRLGSTECAAGAAVCLGNVEPSQELCDGLDNDCDGLVDNDCLGDDHFMHGR